MLHTPNKLIAGLPDLHQFLARHVRLTVLPKGRTIYSPDEEFVSVYLIEKGIATFVCGDGPAGLHVAMIGPEGMVGIGALVGTPTALFQTVAFTEITALAISTRVFDEAVTRSPELRSRFLRFWRALVRQVGETAQVNGRLTVEQRLARWIDLAADRLGANIPATHEDMAAVIGCRRAGVTMALHLLEGERIIRSTRAKVQVLDQERLRQFAGSRSSTGSAAHSQAPDASDGEKAR